jgi:hypothetical protein
MQRRKKPDTEIGKGIAEILTKRQRGKNQILR